MPGGCGPCRPCGPCKPSKKSTAKKPKKYTTKSSTGKKATTKPSKGGCGSKVAKNVPTTSRRTSTSCRKGGCCDYSSSEYSSDSYDSCSTCCSCSDCCESDCYSSDDRRAMSKNSKPATCGGCYRQASESTSEEVPKSVEEPAPVIEEKKDQRKNKQEVVKPQQSDEAEDVAPKSELGEPQVTAVSVEEPNDVPAPTSTPSDAAFDELGDTWTEAKAVKKSKKKTREDN